MKVTTQICKFAITRKCKEITDFIKKEFVPELTDEQVQQAFDDNNWKRRSKSKDSYMIPNRTVIERMFDCKPFDDQLRAYVYTDESDQHILRIDIHGE